MRHDCPEKAHARPGGVRRVPVWCRMPIHGTPSLLIAPSSPHLMKTMREWSRIPSAFSSALLCSWLFDPKQMEVWERMCRRAIMVLTQHVDIQREHNWKGHIVSFDSTLQVAYCVRCFVSRKIRDQLFRCVSWNVPVI